MTEIASPKNLIKLRVEDLEDMEVIAPLLQDALVSVEDMALLAAEHQELNQQFMILASRFCWEQSCKEQSSHAAARIHTAFVINHVQSIQYKGIDRSDKNLILSLLTIAADENNLISLFFAGDAVIQIKVDRLSCVLQDMAESWPTKFVPHHTIGQ